MIKRLSKIIWAVCLFSFISGCGQQQSNSAIDKKILKAAKELPEKNAYLEKNVFYGLSNLNTGFDAPGIKYFSEKEFRIVLDRVKQLGIGILGIEPWKNGEFYGVEVYEDYTDDPSDSVWYLKAFEKFKKTGDTIQYSASYFIPERLLKKP